MATPLTLLLFLHLLPFGSSGGSLLQVLKVPQVAFVSGSATLRCVYNLRDASLYSLKWYHNNTEFYRYVPTERHGPVNLGPSNTFSLREVSRDDRHVTLSLGKLRAEAAGVYKCEVMAEHPSFRTESAQAFMTVLSDRLGAPILTGGNRELRADEAAELQCTPEPQVVGEPLPRLWWLLDGQEVGASLVERHGRATFSPEPDGISLVVDGAQVAAAGGSMHVECRVSVGSLRNSASVTLRVRPREHMIAVRAAARSLSPEGNLKLLLAVWLLSALAHRKVS